MNLLIFDKWELIFLPDSQKAQDTEPSFQAAKVPVVYSINLNINYVNPNYIRLDMGEQALSQAFTKDCKVFIFIFFLTLNKPLQLKRT